MGKKQGGAESKGVAAANDPFRRLERHHSKTTLASMGDTSADEVNQRDSFPLLEGTKKPTAVEGEYNCFTVTTFHLCIICNATFHHSAISPCEHGCILCALFLHIHFTIALYHSVSPSHHFTFSLLFRNFTAKRRKKAAL